MTVPTKKYSFHKRVRLLLAVVIVLSVILTIAQMPLSLWKDILSLHHGMSEHMEDLTIVTAYFDLGSFRKGPSQTFSRENYTEWVKTFKYLNNFLVVYTDSVVFRNFFRRLRKGKEQRTKIILVNRTQFWTFRIRDEIQKIFSQEEYPIHYPNTVLPAYSCAQHTKYAAVADTIRKKYFRSKCYAWLDIGYFRDIVNSKRYFSLNLLDDFDKNKLSVNLVYPSVSLNITYEATVYDNHVWVGGGMFIGTADVITAFEAEYQRAVTFLLDKQLMSTDQQVLLSMYSLQGQKDLNVTVQLQLYSRKQNETNLKNDNPWFYLGYKCLNFTSTIERQQALETISSNLLRSPSSRRV